MSQYKIVGNFITAFLDLRESNGSLISGIYSFEEHEGNHLEEIEDDVWSYRIRREASITTEGLPGLVDIYPKVKAVDDVFSISTATPDSYVERSYGAATYDLILKHAVDDPGKTIVMYGPSKLGKTALWQSTLPDSIVVNCRPGLTMEQIYFQIYSTIGKPYLTEVHRELNEEKGYTAEFGASLGNSAVSQLSVKGGASGKTSSKESEKIATPQPTITVDSVSIQLRTSKHALVLENYHRLDKTTIHNLAYDMRTLADHRVSVILVGIPINPYELTSINSELEGRLSYLEFGVWDKKDLAKIAYAGMKALNIEISTDTIEFITDEAAGSPLLMQEFCLLACHASQVSGSQPRKTEVELSRSDFQIAVINYLSTKLRHMVNVHTTLIACCHRIKSLGKEFVADWIREIKNSPKLLINISNMNGTGYSKRSIEALLKRLNGHPETLDMITYDAVQNELNICRPFYVLYVRWMLSV